MMMKYVEYNIEYDITYIIHNKIKLFVQICKNKWMMLDLNVL